jgi:hypothetical protein
MRGVVFGFPRPVESYGREMIRALVRLVVTVALVLFLGGLLPIRLDWWRAPDDGIALAPLLLLYVGYRVVHFCATPWLVRRREREWAKFCFDHNLPVHEDSK